MPEPRSSEPYRLRLGEAAAYHARWTGLPTGPSAPQRYNWILRRAPLSTVSGDLPLWGLMGIERAPRVDPDLIVFALLRVGVCSGGITRWLDSADEMAVEYLPWHSRHLLTWSDGLALTASCTAWENRGCAFHFSGKLPADAELVLELQGLGLTGQGRSSSFVSPEQVRWQERSLHIDERQIVLESNSSKHRVSARVSSGVWEEAGPVLLCRTSIGRQAVELVIATQGTEGFPGYAEAEANTREHYLQVLRDCRSHSPDPVLDAALEAAVVTLDQVHDGPLWLEGLTRWNTYWADNYQIGACVAMGRFDEAREALLALAEAVRGRNFHRRRLGLGR
ncbi:MAG: hypothetical protein HQL31_10025 [Planctomycetes bacterium]|nr:hypothetical protein [Planctomycetota bacterium]